MAGSRTTRSKQKQQQQQQQAKQTDEKRKRQNHVKQTEASPTACVRQLSENLPDLGELVPGQFCWMWILLAREGGMTPTRRSSPSLPSDLQLLCLPAVDSFFGNYITALNRQGASRPAPSGPGDVHCSYIEGIAKPQPCAILPCCC